MSEIPILGTSEKPEEKPIVRDRLKSLRDEPKSGYPPSQCQWGLIQELVARDDQRLAAKIGAAFYELKNILLKKGCKVNPPEVFPVNERSCLVLVTGWTPETIVIES